MRLLGLSDAEILETVKPLAEHTENSWNEKSYENFCRFLNQDTEHKFTEENFNSQVKENYDTFGKHTIAEFVALHRNPENIIVLWKVRFENRKEPGLLMYRFIEKDEKILIEGCTYQA